VKLKDRATFFSTDSTKKFSETDINMLELLIDNIFAMLGGCVFQQTVGIHTAMGTNCAPLLADLNQTGSCLLKMALTLFKYIFVLISFIICLGEFN
jgi:hypothetical protein